MLLGVRHLASVYCCERDGSEEVEKGLEAAQDAASGMVPLMEETGRR